MLTDIEKLIERLWAINCGSQGCQTTRDEAADALARMTWTPLPEEVAETIEWLNMGTTLAADGSPSLYRKTARLLESQAREIARRGDLISVYIGVEAEREAKPARKTACRTCGQTGGNGLRIGHGPCPTCTVRGDNGEMLSRHQPARTATDELRAGAPFQPLVAEPAELKADKLAVDIILAETKYALAECESELAQTKANYQDALGAWKVEIDIRLALEVERDRLRAELASYKAATKLVVEYDRQQDKLDTKKGGST